MGVSMHRLMAAALLASTCLYAADEPRGAAERGVELAMKGQCSDAMPLLDEAMRDSANKPEVKRGVSLAGVRCSMLLNQQSDAMSFLAWLQQAFPHDPDVLLLAVHVFSELSDRSSRELMDTAPDSAQVIQLNAENFEKQRELAKAIAEYRILLKRAPDMPGIHFRIGGLILAQPASASSSEEAWREFESELKIDPQSAGAEYYLGELARQEDKLADAVEHFSRATKLNPRFADAWFGLGRSQLDSGDAAQAIAPLETAAKLAPENPTVHLTLATAYQRSGRREDAAREFALQKSTAEKIRQNTDTLKRNVAGRPADGAAR